MKIIGDRFSTSARNVRQEMMILIGGDLSDVANVRPSFDLNSWEGAAAYTVQLQEYGGVIGDETRRVGT